jgi:LPXTG-site transpeptidase (sortase) family protein
MTISAIEEHDRSPESSRVVEVVPLPRFESPRRRRRKVPYKRVLRLAAAVLAVSYAVYFVHDRLITTLIHDQRQLHLAAEMKSPSTSIGDGDAIAYLQAPAIGLDTVVIEGVSSDNLRGAPARLSGSELPGDPGAMIVVGHRTTYGSPFKDLSRLKSGDSVVAQARNSGPIVKYIVDRVERHTSLAAVDLPNRDSIAYLVLVTSESRWTSNDQIVVVARALPVTSAEPTSPSLPDSIATEAPFGIDGLLAVGAGVASVLAWLFLRKRASTGVRVGLVAAGVAYAVLRLLMSLDSVLPIAR